MSKTSTFFSRTTLAAALGTILLSSNSFAVDYTITTADTIPESFDPALVYSVNANKLCAKLQPAYSALNKMVIPDGVTEFYGTEGDDLIIATNANTTIYAGAGNDVILGKDGDDKLHGEDGDDIICGGAGNNLVFGGTGNDLIVDGDGGSMGGVLFLRGGPGDDAIFGGKGDDLIQGLAGNDYLSGGAGNDTIGGHNGVDGIYGGPGADQLSDHNNDNGNVLDGGGSTDFIMLEIKTDPAETPDQWINGGIGDDTCLVDPYIPTNCEILPVIPE